jgi:hypothetical protein
MWLLIQKKIWTNFTKKFISIFIILKTLLYIYIYLLSTQNCQRTCLTPPWHKCSYSSQKWVSWNWSLYKFGVFVVWWKYKRQSPECMTSQQLQLGLLSWVCLGHIWCVKSVACPGVHHSNHCKSLCEDLHQSFQSFFRCANKHTISFYDINMSR